MKIGELEFNGFRWVTEIGGGPWGRAGMDAGMVEGLKGLECRGGCFVPVSVGVSGCVGRVGVCWYQGSDWESN